MLRISASTLMPPSLDVSKLIDGDILVFLAYPEDAAQTHTHTHTHTDNSI